MSQDADAMLIARSLFADRPELERDIRLELIRARTEPASKEHFTEFGDMLGVAGLIVSTVGVAYQLYDGMKRSDKTVDVATIAEMIGSAMERRQRDPQLEQATVDAVVQRTAEVVIQSDAGRQDAGPAS